MCLVCYSLQHDLSSSILAHFDSGICCLVPDVNGCQSRRRSESCQGKVNYQVCMCFLLDQKSHFTTNYEGKKLHSDKMHIMLNSLSLISKLFSLCPATCVYRRLNIEG